MRSRHLTRAAAIGALVAVVLCLTAGARPAASAPPGGSAAVRCAQQRVDGGRIGGRMTVRAVLIGKVACAEARRVIGTYFTRMRTGRCGQLNNFCALDLPGGWHCSIFSAGVSRIAGGAMLGCARTGPAARIRVFRVGGRSAPAAARRSP